MVASVLAILGTIFALVGCVYPGSLVLHNEDYDTSTGIGLWSSFVTTNDETESDTYACDEVGTIFAMMSAGERTRRGDEEACTDGLESRCMAGRVFSVFGAVFAFTAIVSGAMKKSAKVIGLTNGIACFSTMLCMALLVQLKQGDADLESSSCGLDDAMEYGAGFISFVLAFIFFLMAMIIGCMSTSGADSVSPM